MRAVCDSCEAAQPVDWKPGDLCVRCGQVVRRERRCHWCAGWTPDGRFCRACGAETVPDEQYAAGRMLKHAGVDQFSIVERLRSFDADQIENYTRIFQRQAVVVARLVDDVAFAERFLLQQQWSAALDDELAAKLPMAEDEIAALRLPPGVEPDPAVRLEVMAATAPRPRIRSLAALARLRVSPSPIGTERGRLITDLAETALDDGNLRVRDEAALALSGWRVLYGPRRVGDPRTIAEALRDCIARGVFPSEARVGLRLLGHDIELDASERPTTDGDASFGFAMALGERDGLAAALRSPERRSAAALRLGSLGMGAPLAATIELLPEADAAAVLEAFPRDSKQPALHDALMRIAESTTNDQLRKAAVKLLVAEGRPADARRLASLAPSERWILQSVLQRMPLDTADLTALCNSLVADGRFSMNQYGITDLAADARLRDDFVPRAWSNAASDDVRLSLLRFAEEQLKSRADDALQAFMLGIVFGTWPAAMRGEAWWCLKRWYATIEYASQGPLVLEAGAIERFFPSVEVFLGRFAAVLGDRATLEEMALQEKLSSMLRYAATDALATVVTAPGWARVRDVLVRLTADAAVRLDLRASTVRFFEHVAALDAVQREGVLRDLAAITEASVPDLAYEASSTAERIQRRAADAARAAEPATPTSGRPDDF